MTYKNIKNNIKPKQKKKKKKKKKKPKKKKKLKTLKNYSATTHVFLFNPIILSPSEYINSLIPISFLAEVS